MMSQFYNNIKTVILLAVLTGLIMWIGSLFGPNGLWIALIFAGVMNFVRISVSVRSFLFMPRAGTKVRTLTLSRK